MRKRSQAYHAQTQEEYQLLMQEDDIAQKNKQSLILQEKPGIVDQIEWLETPDFLEVDSKYKLELNTSSDSDGSASARKKCLIVIDDNQQLNEYFSKSFFPHLFSETPSHKILELVYSSSEEEMWIHFRPLRNSSHSSAGATAAKAGAQADQTSASSSFQKSREESSYNQQSLKNSLYCNIIEESFYPYADYIVLFSSEQAKEIQEWKQQKCRYVKPSQKIYIYNKQRHAFLAEDEQECSEVDSTSSQSPPSSSELNWFGSIKGNSNKEDYLLQQQSSPNFSSYSMIKTLINQA